MFQNKATADIRHNINKFKVLLARLEPFELESALATLARECFTSGTPLAVFRKFFQCVVLCCYKSNVPVSLNDIISILNGDLSPSRLCEKLEIKPYTNLKLCLFGGMVEAMSSCSIDLNEVLGLATIYLSSHDPDVLIECVEVINLYINFRWTSGNSAVSKEEVNLLETTWSHLLSHCDSDHMRVLKVTKQFFEGLFELAFVKDVLPPEVINAVTKSVIEEGLFQTPFCLNEPVVLTKGAIRLIGVLVEHAPLEFVFERSPYLVTSLLLALAWNHSAALAADVLTTILKKVRLDVNKWLVEVHTPLANFLVHGVISSSAEQQLKFLAESDVFSAAKLRLSNFLLHCCTSALGDLPVGDLFHESQDPPTNDVPFILIVLNQLGFLASISNDFVDFRLLSFVSLLPLLSLAHADEVLTEYSSVVDTALIHESDRIRAQTCRSLSKLVVREPAGEFITSAGMYRRVFKGVASLMASTDPTARNVATRAFFDVALHLRNRCAAIASPRSASLRSNLERQWTPAKLRVNGYPEIYLEYSKQPNVSPFEALAEVYQFASCLWSKNNVKVDVLSDSNASCLSPLVREAMSRPLIPPGMPYMRQVMLVTLVSGLFEISLLHVNNHKISKRYGFEPRTVKNLQEIINFVCEITGFPLPNESATLMQLVVSLPNATSEIQTRLLELLTTYWPAELMPSDEVIRNLVELAKCWCGFQQPDINIAGANLLQWIIISHPNLVVGRGYASNVLTRMADWSSSFVDWRQNHGPKESSYMPIIGYLSAIDGVFSWCNKALSCSKPGFPLPTSERPEDVTPLERLECFLDLRLPQYCIDLSRECLVILGVPYCYTEYDGSNLSQLIAGCETSSFDNLGQSLLRQIKKTGEEIDNATSDSALIELSSEYQRLLSFGWISLKVASNVLVKWTYLSICKCLMEGGDLDESSRRYVALIGKQLIGTLMACRHKGLVEALYQSLRDYLAIAASLRQRGSSLAEVFVQPSQVLDVCALAVKVAKFSVTRRGAGLWPATKAALMAQMLVSPQCHDLLLTWLNSMLEVVDSAEPPPSTAARDREAVQHDPPRALALHLMKGVFEDSRLGPVAFTLPPPAPMDSWLTTVFCRLILPNFADPEWTVSNGALQLFTAMIKRLLGPLHTRPGTGVAEVFGRYPQLFTAFVGVLAEPCLEDGTTRASVMPLLALLSRLSPSPDIAFSLKLQGKLQACLWKYVVHKDPKVRRLASKALVAFFAPPGNARAEMAQIAELSKSGLSPSLTRVTSGQAFAIDAWISSAPTRRAAGERAKLVDWEATLEFMKYLGSARIQHYFLAAQLADLLRRVFLVIPESEKLRYLGAFRKLFPPNYPDYCPSNALSMALYPTFLTALTDLRSAMQEKSVLTVDFNSSKGIDQMTHLLSHSKDSSCPKVVEMVNADVCSPALLRLALEGFPVSSPVHGDEKAVLRCLHRLKCLVSEPENGENFHSLLPGVLLAMASLMFGLNRQVRASFYSWWLEKLETCLESTASEQSRSLASKALLKWCNAMSSESSESVDDRKSVMNGIFYSGLFDPCSEVRQTISQAYGVYSGVRMPHCLSHIAHCIFVKDGSPEGWQIGFLETQLEEIVGRAELLDECRRKNIFYEPDYVNPYYDAQYTLCLILSSAASQHSKLEQIGELLRANYALLEKYLPLEEPGDLRAATIVYTSASLHQIALTKVLSTN